MLKNTLRPLKNWGTATTWRIGHRYRLVRPIKAPVSFVVEKADWSIRWDGEHIRDVANEITGNTTVEVTDSAYRVTEQVVHFGSQYMWLHWGRFLSKRNRFVVSFFHGKPEDGPQVEQHIESFLKSVPSLTTVITAASMMEQRLLKWGVPREKLVRIPIGVNTRSFRLPTPLERAKSRDRFGFTPDQVVIGSFQKDGVGWGYGMEPKLIKGPDIFIAAVERIARVLPVSVLLTGPARGYVKNELNRRGIPFVHIYIKEQASLADCYHALDLYLVTSREEGGPKGIMESMASGVPIVSTCVGMAPDLIVDGVTGGLAESEDVEGIVERALRILSLPEGESANLKVQAAEAVKVCDWSVVGRRHLKEVYEPLLDHAS